MKYYLKTILDLKNFQFKKNFAFEKLYGKNFRLEKFYV